MSRMPFQDAIRCDALACPFAARQRGNGDAFLSHNLLSLCSSLCTFSFPLSFISFSSLALIHLHFFSPYFRSLPPFFPFLLSPILIFHLFFSSLSRPRLVSFRSLPFPSHLPLYLSSLLFLPFSLSYFSSSPLFQSSLSSSSPPPRSKPVFRRRQNRFPARSIKAATATLLILPKFREVTQPESLLNKFANSEKK